MKSESAQNEPSAQELSRSGAPKSPEGLPHASVVTLSSLASIDLKFDLWIRVHKFVAGVCYAYYDYAPGRIAFRDREGTVMHISLAPSNHLEDGCCRSIRPVYERDMPFAPMWRLAWKAPANKNPEDREAARPTVGITRNHPFAQKVSTSGARTRLLSLVCASVVTVFILVAIAELRLPTTWFLSIGRS